MSKCANKNKARLKRCSNSSHTSSLSCSKSELSTEMDSDLSRCELEVNLEKLIDNVINKSFSLTTDQFYKEYLQETLDNNKIYKETVCLSEKIFDVEHSEEITQIGSFDSQNRCLTEIHESPTKHDNDRNKCAEINTEMNIEQKSSVHGTWVECVLCLKWRFLKEILDPSLLIESWHCGLQEKYINVNEFRSEILLYASNPCDEPQQELENNENSNSFVYTKFTAGSLVWAKLDGYPEWPAMIDCDATGHFAEFDQTTREVIRYCVVFLDPHRITHQCIRANRIRKYTHGEEKKISKSSRYYQSLIKSIEEAEKALNMSLEERLFMFGYPYSEHKCEDSHKGKIKQRGVNKQESSSKMFNRRTDKTSNNANDDNKTSSDKINRIQEVDLIPLKIPKVSNEE
ncbi:unnamed protein product [Schistosoma turkestanicum]|nr:unnamed protein product [Schistosoma turkestanicum]